MNDTKYYVLAKELTPKMFNEIAEDYDKLDHKLSFGLDNRWRKYLVKYLKNYKENYEIIIDIASGTGDLLLQLKNLKAHKLIAIDPSNKMLNIAKTKVPDADFIVASAENLPIPDNYTDLITVAFGIRNFANLNKALNEFKRILKENGKIAIMEFAVPDNLLPAIGFKIYVKYFIPIIGYLHTGNYIAYKYLSESIFEFSNTTNVTQMLIDNGFKNIKQKKFIFGGVRIYCANKQ